MPALQQRAVRRNLVDAVQATGARRAFDRVRLACWSLESGLEVDPVTLSLGSTASLFGMGQAIASRLAEVMPDAQATVDMGLAVPRNHDLAVRLARLAYERNDGVVEGVALATTLAWTGATEEAEGVLAEVEAKVEAIDDRLRLATALAWVRFWGRFDVEAAEAGLRAALEVATPEADRDLVAEAYQQLAGIALNTSRPNEAIELSERAAEVLEKEISRTPAAAVAAAALAYVGRCSETLSLVDRAVPEAQKGGHPLHVANLLFARAAALARSGQLEEGRRLAEWLREVAISRDVLDAAASVGVLIGEIFLRQGKPASASRVLRDCAGLLAERDVFGYRTWALAGLARARARTGDEQAAALAFGEARQSRLIGRHYDLAYFAAESEVHCLEGRPEAAIKTLERAVDWSRRAGMVIDEAYALDALVRLSPAGSTADRLAELATLTDSEIVAVTAAHARALVAADAGGLLRAAERFAEMTAWWMAAEAAAAAGRVFEKGGDSRAAKAAERAATGYLSHCEGARSSLPSPDEHSVLTKRELEIATLAASGHSNKDIAASTYLSQRTVENHLYHAYTKLGVADRADLAAALALPE
jgi:DNA-binding NarL/FixJ family response regulator